MFILTNVTSHCIGLGCFIHKTHTFYQLFGSWLLLISTLQWNDFGREKSCRNSSWTGVLLLLSCLYRTWQNDNILSTILSDTRLWSSPIINPGWAPAQVVQERRPTDCQHVWQTPSIPQNLEMILHRRHFWHSLPHTRWTQQSFSQQTHLWNSLLDHC